MHAAAGKGDERTLALAHVVHAWYGMMLSGAPLLMEEASPWLFKAQGQTTE
jgi:hypothetical protein